MSGAANLGCSRLSSRLVGLVRPWKSRLKAGCRQDCLPQWAHLILLLMLCASAAGAPDLPIPTMPPLNRLVFGGDVMMSRFVGTLAHANNDPAGPLRDIADVFSTADIAFVNLESPFSDEGKPTTKGMVFKAAPDMIDALNIAGIHIVSTANNHARDCGSYGVGFTLDLLAKNKIAAVGSAASGEEVHQGKVLERHGIRFGFLGYTYNQSNGNYKDTDERIAMLDPEQVREDVAGLAMRSDVVIVSMHAGTEYMPKPNDEQKRFAHAAIDAGAKIVIGHHSHVIQPVEEYGGGVIFYSLGNLVFDQFQRKETQVGRVVEAFFLGKTLVKYNLVPVDIVRTVPRVHVEPVPAPKRKRPVKPGSIPAPKTSSNRMGGIGFSLCAISNHAPANACTTKSSFLCAPRRIVGQAILPATGFRAGSALDLQSRRAGWKAGCSQDWLSHFAAKPHCATTGP